VANPKSIRSASNVVNVPVKPRTAIEGFWRDRLALFRTITLNDIFDKFEVHGALENFDAVAVGKKGGHSGPPFYDGLIYETIRGASDFLATYPDEDLSARLDGYINRIAAAQAADPDGYLNTYVTLLCPDQRWGNHGGNQLWHHEVYNAGCLVEAATHHWKATGKTTLLRVAIRFTNYMIDYMGPPPKRSIIPAHSLPEEAVMDLYRLLHSEPHLAKSVGARNPDEYRNLVRFWIENRGSHEHRISFTEYAQDHVPLAEQKEALGHSVRALLCYTGVASYCREVESPAYVETLKALWKDVTFRKMHISGGIGAIEEYEGFAFGYYLPNSGYIETCAGIALAFWANQMNLLFLDATHADVVERTLYNIAMGGISLDGTHYAYRNPLKGDGNLRRWEWHDCPCCPPMLMKLMSLVPSLVLSVGQGNIYVNQYVGGEFVAPLDDQQVNITQTTNYPWGGKISVDVSVENALEFGLFLRIPDWAKRWSLGVNGESLVSPAPSNGYVELQRTWSTGDKVEIDFPMPIERLEANPNVQHNRGRIALMRGPILYCVEAVDNQGSAEIEVAVNPELEHEYVPNLLGGVVVVRGRAADGTTFSAVPYFSRGNRTEGPDDFAVWLKQAGMIPRNVPDGEDWLYRAYVPEGH
jgi:DUF1680 family protein